MKSKLVVLVLLVAFALALVSCNLGGGGDDTTTAATTTEPSTTGTAVRTEPAKPVTTVPVTTVDDSWSDPINP